jgi:hypothetical protein
MTESPNRNRQEAKLQEIERRLEQGGMSDVERIAADRAIHEALQPEAEDAAISGSRDREFDIRPEEDLSRNIPSR